MTDLTWKDFHLTIREDLGASVTKFTFRDAPVLRTVPEDVTSSGDCGLFPLVPYGNRIARGKFTFGGQTVQEPMAFPDHPHALHGHGWRTRWQPGKVLTSDAATTIEMGYNYTGTSWPWPYAARQVFTLDDTGLTVRLSVKNTGNKPMPTGLGLHPWFTRTENTTLQAAVKQVWLTDPTLLPTELVDGKHFLDFSAGAALKDSPFIDNCYTGWSGPMTLTQPDLGHEVIMSAHHCPFLHIYAPVGSDFVCAEPVTAMPDSFNRKAPATETGLRVLAPAETFAMAMHLEVRAL